MRRTSKGRPNRSLVRLRPAIDGSVRGDDTRAAGEPARESSGHHFPWEQIFLAAAACAGSDYPMLAAHYGVPLERTELVIEGVFDPRGAFDGLAGLDGPVDARPCYLALHLRALLVSPAPRHRLEQIHARVLSHNMVLGALRGIRPPAS